MARESKVDNCDDIATKCLMEFGVFLTKFVRIKIFVLYFNFLKELESILFLPP